MSQLDKDDALAIAKKLGATIDKSTPRHEIATVVIDGIKIAHIGIRRGSRRDQGHGHLTDNVHLSQQDTKRLSICELSKADWITRMQDAGYITPKQWPMVCTKNKRHVATVTAHSAPEDEACESCGAPMRSA